MWVFPDPGPGLEPMSPALAGRFFTTAPLGKSLKPVFLFKSLYPFLHIELTQSLLKDFFLNAMMNEVFSSETF